MTNDQGIPVDEPAIEPRPMTAKPFLQVLSWLGGVAAGGVFIAILTITPSRVYGATRAMRLRWQQRSHDAGEAVVALEQRTAVLPVTSTQEDEDTLAQDRTGAPPATEP